MTEPNIPSCNRDGCCRMPNLGCDLCPKHLAEVMKPPPQAAPDARALAAAIGMKYAELEFKMRGCKVEAYISRVRLAGLIALAVKEALLPTAPPAETAELEALKEALVSNAVEFIDMGGNPLGDAAFAYRRLESSVDIYELKLAEREAAGGGK